MEERDRQIEAFKDIRKAISLPIAEECIASVEAWERDPSKPNPYVTEHTGKLHCHRPGSVN